MSVAPLKIMPIGDSITAGVEFINNKSTCENGGYRTHLWRSFQKDGLVIEFVGTQSDGPPDISVRHEGHPGWNTSQLLQDIPHWLMKYDVQIVLIMTGTNDIIQIQDANIAIGRLYSLINKVFETRPEISLALASILPLKWSESRKHLQPIVVSYNTKMHSLACKYESKGMHISYVDIFNGLDKQHMFGSHPSPSGYKKIAEIWYPILRNLIIQY